ncbi:Tetraspannin domain containing protein [Trichuris trichiura]|uniref:Tetraspannin domain containing protein n=1 Tax=Trichuris trichiura TaxID=36087 RepID=A0A077YX56_TRITR|nr:Tetraspannin domain containing protein [Trichuris trichiura]
MRGGESVASTALNIAVRLEGKAVIAKAILLLLTIVLAFLSVVVITKTNSSFGKITDVISELETAGKSLDETEAANIKTKEFAIFYLAILVSSMAAVLHIVGLFGAIFESEFALRFYSLFIFTFLAVASIIATSWLVVAEERTMEFLRGFYRLYLESYYKEDPESFLDSFIDDVQRSNECCGYYTFPVDSEGYESYMTILYFLEMTSFGQKQASGIGWVSGGLVSYVPRSCCIKPEAGCSSDIYGASKGLLDKANDEKIGSSTTHLVLRAPPSLRPNAKTLISSTA